MAKAKSSKAASSKPPAPSFGDDAPLWRRRAVRHVAGFFLFVGVCAAAVYVAGQYVDREVASSTGPFIIVVKHRPTWMSDLLVRQIADVAQPPVLPQSSEQTADEHHHADLAALIGGSSRTGYSAFDRDLLVQVHTRLAADPWIAQVRQVRRAYTDKPGDTIEIDCTYRVPTALVKWRDGYWLVASDGYKLPERYDPAMVPNVMGQSSGLPPLRIIEGVSHAPPSAGQEWLGDDLRAGLNMVALLSTDPVADAVLKIDVSNFSGRVDPREAHIVLITKYNTQIRWGRPASDDQSFEISPAKKLQCLERIAAQYGRIDANQPWIDVRFDTVRIPSGKPADDAGGSGGGGESHADEQQ
jgi:hypothetical protein